MIRTVAGVATSVVLSRKRATGCLADARLVTRPAWVDACRQPAFSATTTTAAVAAIVAASAKAALAGFVRKCSDDARQIPAKPTRCLLRRATPLSRMHRA